MAWGVVGKDWVGWGMVGWEVMAWEMEMVVVAVVMA